ncbi:MAG: hypothetical protein ABSG79_05640 [Bryobacteraceae bacterium]|jgi:hypothetical protein
MQLRAKLARGDPEETCERLPKALLFTACEPDPCEPVPNLLITRPKVPITGVETGDAVPVPQPTTKTLYVVVTPELLVDHEVSGAALAEWTNYAVPAPEMVVVSVGATCYTAHQIPNLGKGAFQCVTAFLVASQRFAPGELAGHSQAFCSNSVR